MTLKQEQAWGKGLSDLRRKGGLNEAITEDTNQPTTIDINSKTAEAMNTVVVELAHREALEAEAIKNDINAKLAANGYTANGEAIKRE